MCGVKCFGMAFFSGSGYGLPLSFLFRSVSTVHVGISHRSGVVRWRVPRAVKDFAVFRWRRRWSRGAGGLVIELHYVVTVRRLFVLWALQLRCVSGLRCFGVAGMFFVAADLVGALVDRAGAQCPRRSFRNVRTGVRHRRSGEDAVFGRAEECGAGLAPSASARSVIRNVLRHMACPGWLPFVDGIRHFLCFKNEIEENESARTRPPRLIPPSCPRSVLNTVCPGWPEDAADTNRHRQATNGARMGKVVMLSG